MEERDFECSVDGFGEDMLVVCDEMLQARYCEQGVGCAGTFGVEGVA